MNSALHDLATPRQPQQDRSRERFENIVAAADQLLLETGLHGFSIPIIAERLGYNRRSVYMFFPTPYALLNELTRRYIERMEVQLAEIIAPLANAPIIELVARVTYAAADFHNANPVGRLLILGGAVTDRSYRVQEMNIKHLGELARQLMQAHDITLPPAPPDIPTVSVELGTACFRLSHARHQRILPEYKVEAAFAMLSYLHSLISTDAPPTREQLQRYL